MKSFLFLIVVVSFSSCSKYDSGVVLQLPDKTKTGANSLGFLLGNEVWRNYGQSCTFSGGCTENLKGYYYKSDGDITINAYKALNSKNQPNTIESFGINVATSYRGLKRYSRSLGDSVDINYSFINGQTERYYAQSLSNTNFTVTFSRFDTTNNIFSDEFSGTLYLRTFQFLFSTSTTDSIVVKEGRFDVRANLNTIIPFQTRPLLENCSSLPPPAAVQG